VFGDEDPTQILIESAPAFRIEKVSTYLDGDPSVLLAGERLRYTITVKNIGTDNATGVVLRDEIPANTRYVAGSTTLNGAPVPDSGSGGSPLSDGILINAPEDPTPGAMRADASDTQDNVATITFEVIVNEDVVNGTVISNQASSARRPAASPTSPRTIRARRSPTTRRATWSATSPLLVAEKTVALLVDEGSPGIVDPGDVLRYTITLYNIGNVAGDRRVLATRSRRTPPTSPTRCSSTGCRSASRTAASRR
jgi:large repetitive protein